MITEEKKLKPAFTIAELLIALAISALIMVTAAMAFNILIDNYKKNENIFKTTNLAQQVLSRITTQLRTATAVDPNEAASQCSLITADGQDITYKYIAADNKIYLITNDDASDADYLLCENVTSMNFQKQTATKLVDTESGPVQQTYVKCVKISLTVQCGDSIKTVSTAVAIRRDIN